MAVLNGQDGLSVKSGAGAELNATENKDFDNFKDVMARVTYNLKLGDYVGLDLGANGYFGAIKSLSTTTYYSDYKTTTNSGIGDKLSRNWLGGEFQLYADVLGGMSFKGEYIAGENASVGFVNTATTPGVANFKNNFAGGYLYVIKNLGKKNQFAFRYDYYDPNKDITGKDVGIAGYPGTTTYGKRTSGKSDLATTTYGFALHHYFDDNLRITLGYDIVQNEKVGTPNLIVDSYTTSAAVSSKLDWSQTINQNVLTLRIQAKF